MILVSGSWLVRDSGKHNDIDVIYLTWDIGKYLLMLIHKREVEDRLRKKYYIKVSFTPYLVFSPTIIGNLFLAITLLRYPIPKPRLKHILKLTLGRRDKRWLLIHFAFALLGLISAKNLRDHAKYCSMISENLLYIENSRIPNSWKKTILMGYAIALKNKLINLSKMLSLCYKCMKRGEPTRLPYIRPSIIIEAVNEYLKLINFKHKKLLHVNLSDALRRIHELIMWHILRQEIRWMECSFIIISLIHPRILVYILENPMAKDLVATVFNKCKQEIPVLSPLAHP